MFTGIFFVLLIVLLIITFIGIFGLVSLFINDYIAGAAIFKIKVYWGAWIMWVLTTLFIYCICPSVPDKAEKLVEEKSIEKEK